MTMPKDQPSAGEDFVGMSGEPACFGRASIYHFLEIALAHPDEDGLEWIAAPSTEAALERALDTLAVSDRLDAAREPLAMFFERLRARPHEDVEAEHIALFSANFPTVPCPPYGSLFTVEEAKRLEEMTAIKAFYRDSGFDVAEHFDDLPDHLCVELELLHVLTHQAETARDALEIRWARERAAAFVDRFVAPFLERIVAIAEAVEPDNTYTRLLAATRHVVASHREELAADAAEASQHKGHLA